MPQRPTINDINVDNINRSGSINIEIKEIKGKYKDNKIRFIKFKSSKYQYQL